MVGVSFVNGYDNARVSLFVLALSASVQSKFICNMARHLVGLKVKMFVQGKACY